MTEPEDPDDPRGFDPPPDGIAGRMSSGIDDSGLEWNPKTKRWEDPK